MIILRDVLLVCLDDVGFQDSYSVGPYGVVCPNLHGLRLGARDHQYAFSNPVCSQSRSLVLFGALGRTLGYTGDLGGLASSAHLPPASWPTLAGVLQGHGWRTHKVGKWHLGGTPEGASGVGPIARGYDAWRAGTVLNLEAFRNWQRHDASPLGDEVTVEPRYATLVQVEEAEAFWAEPKTCPRFLHVSFNDAHTPYDAPPAVLLGSWPVPEIGDSKRRVFQAKLHAADTALGRLLALPGMAEALVVVYADNGTSDRSADPSLDPDHAKATTYDPGIRVPLVVRAPGIGASIQNELVHLVDIPTWILENLGFGKPAEWDGALMGSRTFVISESSFADGKLDQCVRTTQHKLRAVSVAPDPPMEELYDLQADPLETTPLDLQDPAFADLLDGLRCELYPGPQP